MSAFEPMPALDAVGSRELPLAGLRFPAAWEAIGPFFASGLADLVPMGVHVVDARGVLIHYNQLAAATWGREPARGDARQMYSGAHRLYQKDGTPLPHDQGVVARVLRDGHAGANHETVIERPDGTRRTVEVHARRMTDAAGLIMGVLACTQDVTERRRAEQDYLTKAFLSDAVICNVPQSLFLLDPLGRITFANAVAEQTFGWMSTEMLGQDFYALLADEGLTATDAGDVTRDREAVFRRRDGSRVRVSYSQTPVVSGGRGGGAVLVVHDISEHKRVEAELTAAKEAAEQARVAAEAANRAKDQFLAVLSHELRTPLTPVLTTVQMMERDITLPAELREPITMIRRNVELEARLIDDLLDLTRIARGKLELHLGTADVHDKLRQVMRICDSDLRAKQLELVVELRATRTAVRADMARLQQILWNLLKNAVKFTPTGGRVRLRTMDLSNAPGIDESNAAIGIEVEDNGIGIDAEALPRIFNAFEQGGREVTRLFGGMGLGLSIAHALVGLHGGTLTASSAGKGRGSTFRVTLPSAVAVEEPPGHIGLPGPDSGGRPDVRILLVEDHADTSRAMTRLLRSCGYGVRAADTVASALQAAQAEKFDLLISDIGLPDGSGLDLIRQLQAQHRIRGIALSGFGMDEDVQRSREAGFLDHLTKPVNLARLEEAIAKILPAE